MADKIRYIGESLIFFKSAGGLRIVETEIILPIFFDPVEGSVRGLDQINLSHIALFGEVDSDADSNHDRLILDLERI